MESDCQAFTQVATHERAAYQALLEASVVDFDEEEEEAARESHANVTAEHFGTRSRHQEIADYHELLQELKNNKAFGLRVKMYFESAGWDWGIYERAICGEELYLHELGVRAHKFAILASLHPFADYQPHSQLLLAHLVGQRPAWMAEYYLMQFVELDATSLTKPFLRINQAWCQKHRAAACTTMSEVATAVHHIFNTPGCAKVPHIQADRPRGSTQLKEWNARQQACHLLHKLEMQLLNFRMPYARTDISAVLKAISVKIDLQHKSLVDTVVTGNSYRSVPIGCLSTDARGDLRLGAYDKGDSKLYLLNTASQDPFWRSNLWLFPECVLILCDYMTDQDGEWKPARRLSLTSSGACTVLSRLDVEMFHIDPEFDPEGAANKLHVIVQAAVTGSLVPLTVERPATSAAVQVTVVSRATVAEVIVGWVTVHGFTWEAMLSHDRLLGHRLPGIDGTMIRTDVHALYSDEVLSTMVGSRTPLKQFLWRKAGQDPAIVAPSDFPTQPGALEVPRRARFSDMDNMLLARRMDAELCWQGTALSTAQVSLLKPTLPPAYVQSFSSGKLFQANLYDRTTTKAFQELFFALLSRDANDTFKGLPCPPRVTPSRASLTTVLTKTGEHVTRAKAEADQQRAATAYASKQATGSRYKFSPEEYVRMGRRLQAYCWDKAALTFAQALLITSALPQAFVTKYDNDKSLHKAVQLVCKKPEFLRIYDGLRDRKEGDRLEGVACPAVEDTPADLESFLPGGAGRKAAASKAVAEKLTGRKRGRPAKDNAAAAASQGEGASAAPQPPHAGSSAAAVRYGAGPDGIVFEAGPAARATAPLLQVTAPLPSLLSSRVASIPSPATRPPGNSTASAARGPGAVTDLTGDSDDDAPSALAVAAPVAAAPVTAGVAAAPPARPRPPAPKPRTVTAKARQGKSAGKPAGRSKPGVKDLVRQGRLDGFMSAAPAPIQGHNAGAAISQAIPASRGLQPSFSVAGLGQLSHTHASVGSVQPVPRPPAPQAKLGNNAVFAVATRAAASHTESAEDAATGFVPGSVDTATVTKPVLGSRLAQDGWRIGGLDSAEPAATSFCTSRGPLSPTSRLSVNSPPSSPDKRAAKVPRVAAMVPPVRPRVSANAQFQAFKAKLAAQQQLPATGVVPSIPASAAPGEQALLNRFSSPSPRIGETIIWEESD